MGEQSVPSGSLAYGEGKGWWPPFPPPQSTVRLASHADFFWPFFPTAEPGLRLLGCDLNGKTNF